MADMLGISDTLQPSSELFTAANGQRLETLGTATITVRIQSLDILVDLIVFRDLDTEFILGMNFFNASQASIDFRARSISFPAQFGMIVTTSFLPISDKSVMTVFPSPHSLSQQLQR